MAEASFPATTSSRSFSTDVQVTTVPSFAKLNLDLRVLAKRPDQFHELRTIFQTISLKDTLEIGFVFSKRTSVHVDSSVDIADNLIVRSALLILDALKISATVNFKLTKKIPMGAGLGGGSSNAAAVLLALPALAGKRLSPGHLLRFAETLGSDIPFFLLGGTAVALGRGTELYPLPEIPAHHALVVSTGIHVSTPLAYQSLKRDVTNALTSPATSPILREFQAITWALESSAGADARYGQLPFKNDFEEAVFKTHPELAVAVRKLRKLGAKPALMTGSGSALFGIFSTAAQARAAARAFPPGHATPVRFLTRVQYRKIWVRALGPAAEASIFA
jgi:4-diphosphocytidyl-2-C-methyl-D-erythritol kinase